MFEKKLRIVLKYLLYLQKFYAGTILTYKLSKSNIFFFIVYSIIFPKFSEKYLMCKKVTSHECIHLYIWSHGPVDA